MIGEQLQLLLMLYARPVRAASRIIDHGRLGFAFCAALLVLLVLPPCVVVAPPRSLMRILILAIDPGSMIRMMTATAAGIYTGGDPCHDALPMARKFPGDAAERLSHVAELHPVIDVGGVPAAGGFEQVFSVHALLALAILIATEIYFLVLVTFCVRTMWGSGLAMAALAAVVGLAAMFGGMVALLLLGSLMYFLASPLVLYFAYILLGSDIRSLGEGLRARQHLRRQLDIAAINPSDADAHYQLGLIYQQRHQYDEAKRRFARSVEIDAKEADPIFQLGRIALEEERFNDAIELLNRAAALDDKCSSHEVWRDLGVAYLRSGRLEEARLALSKYVERRAYDPEGLYWYGKSLLAMGKLDDARRQFEQCREAVETMPKNRRRQLSKWRRLAVAELR